MGSTPLLCAMQNALGADASVGLQIDSIPARTNILESTLHHSIKCSGIFRTAQHTYFNTKKYILMIYLIINVTYIIFM